MVNIYYLQSIWLSRPGQMKCRPLVWTMALLSFVALTAPVVDGKLFGWGETRSLGLGIPIHSTNPAQFTISDVAQTQTAIYAVTDNGQLYGWGLGLFCSGRQGIIANDWRTWDFVEQPRRMLAADDPSTPEDLRFDPVKNIAVTNQGNFLILTRNRQLWVGGPSNPDSNLLVSTAYPNGVECPISIVQDFSISGTSEIVGIAGGDAAFFVIASDGIMYGWGYNGPRQVFDLSTNSLVQESSTAFIQPFDPRPLVVPSPSPIIFNGFCAAAAIGARSAACCSATGELFIGGYRSNFTDQDPPFDLFTPVLLPGGLKCAEVRVHDATIFVISTTGAVVSVGVPTADLLGRPEAQDVDVFLNVLYPPAAINFGPRIVILDMAVGGDSAFAVYYNVSSGERGIYSWGLNDNSQLMTGSTKRIISTPTRSTLLMNYLRSRGLSPKRVFASVGVHRALLVNDLKIGSGPGGISVVQNLFSVLCTDGSLHTFGYAMEPTSPSLTSDNPPSIISTKSSPFVTPTDVSSQALIGRTILAIKGTNSFPASSPVMLQAQHCRRSSPSSTEVCTPEIWLWGPVWNTFGIGAYGAGSIAAPTPIGLPSIITDGTESITDITVGSGHAVFLTSTGRLFGAGNNLLNQMGVFSTGVSSSFDQFVQLQTPATPRLVAAAYLSTWFTTADGRIYFTGRFGTVNASSFTLYSLSGSSITPEIISLARALETSGDALYLVANNGGVWVWGAPVVNSEGVPIEPPAPQFTCTYNRISNYAQNSLVPTALPLPVLITGGRNNIIRRVNPGRDIVVFENELGQLFMCYEPPKLELPLTFSVVPSLPDARSVKNYSVASGHIVALATDNTVWTLGRNGFGQRGLGFALSELLVNDLNVTWAQIVIPDTLRGREIDSVAALNRVSFLVSNMRVTPSTDKVIGVLSREITFSGKGFGPIANAPAAAADLDVRLFFGNASVPCSPSLQADSETLSCATGDGFFNARTNFSISAPLFAQVSRVRGPVAGEKSNFTQVGILVNFPQVNACNPTAGNCPLYPFNTREIVIRGSGFGSSVADLIVFFDAYGDCAVVSANDSVIVCIPPPAIRAGALTGTVSRGNPSVSRLSLIPLTQPIAVMIDPPSILFNQDEVPLGVPSLEIRGSGFGNSMQDVVVRVAGDSICPVTFINDSTIRCSPSGAIPTTFRGPLRAIVSRNAGDSPFQTVATIVGPPSLTIPENAASINIAANSDRITLRGSGFGSSSAALQVVLSNSASKRSVAQVNCIVVAVTDSSLTCRPSASLGFSGQPLYASVTRLGASSGTSFLLGTVSAAPSITLTSQTQFITESATSVTISGNNFAASPNQASNVVELSSGSCTVVSATANSMTCQFNSAPVSSAILLASVRVYGGNNTEGRVGIASVVPRPSVTPGTNSILVGTSDITLIGTNFDERPNPFRTTAAFLSFDSFARVLDGSKPTNRSSSLFECVISSVAGGSIVCSVGTSLNSTGTLYAIVVAYGGVSETTQIGIVERSSSLSAAERGGAIAGGAIGGVIVVVVIVLLVLYRMRLSRFERYKKEMESAVPDEIRVQFSIRYNDLSFIKKIGEGSFGSVWLAQYKGSHVAVKKLSTAQVQSTQIADFFREASVMLSVPAHPNIVKAYGMCQEYGNFCMVMEFYPIGSLEKFTEARWNNGVVELEEGLRWKIIHGIASGMAHLASNNIVHRDLAARNVLLTSNYNALIADFGMSRVIGDFGIGQTKTDMGPIRWMAPESLQGRVFSEKSDVWHFGVTLFELVYGHHPYQGMENGPVVNWVLGGGSPLTTGEVDALCPPYIRKLMEMIFQFEATSRPTFKNILVYLDTCRPATYGRANYDDIEVDDEYKPKKSRSSSSARKPGSSSRSSKSGSSAGSTRQKGSVDSGPSRSAGHSSGAPRSQSRSKEGSNSMEMNNMSAGSK